MRPTLSSIGSYTYQSAKWLNVALKSFRRHPTALQDSFEFVHNILKTKKLH